MPVWAVGDPHTATSPPVAGLDPRFAELVRLPVPSAVRRSPAQPSDSPPLGRSARGTFPAQLVFVRWRSKALYGLSSMKLIRASFRIDLRTCTGVERSIAGSAAVEMPTAAAGSRGRREAVVDLTHQPGQVGSGDGLAADVGYHDAGGDPLHPTVPRRRRTHRAADLQPD